MQPNKNIKDDIDYLSELGYESFPDAEKDVDELKHKIRTRFGSSTLSNGFIAVVVGLFLGITAFFVIYNSPVLFPSRTELISSNNPLKPEIKDLTLDTVQVTAHRKKEPTEKFLEPTVLDTSLEWGKAEQLERINEITIGLDSTFFEKQELKFSPNSPYVFLHDLKIANYNGYYFKIPQRVVVHGSLDASYGSKNEINDANIPYREYFLHEVIKDAMLAFKQKKYNHCITLLDLISEFSKNDVNCDFYRGMSYFYLQNYEQAYKFFNSALSNNINIFDEESNFYLAQAAIKTKRSEEGKKLLEEIAGLNGFYSQKAKEQLSK